MPHVALAVLTALLLAIHPAAAAHVLNDSDAALQALQRNFENLQRSLQAKGGMGERDLPVIERLRDRYATFNAEHPERRSGIAGELQLSIWLEDHDRVDELFEKLLMLDTEDLSIGHAWAAYFSRKDRRERVDEIYDLLMSISPDSRDIRVTRARRLRQQNQFPRALQVLDELSEEDANDPEVALLRSQCLFAEHRFDEALAVLQQITEEQLDEQPRFRGQVEAALPTRELYIDLWETERALRAAEASADDLPRAEIVTPRGRIVVELFEDNAPNTVANFITLAEDEFFDSSTFHRVVSNFVIQGGDPNTKPDGEGEPGTGGPGYAIADEWEREDARKHFAGTLAMANSGPNTAGSQFYITHQPLAQLNEGYTVFGRVIDGLDVVRSIERDDVIESVRVLRKRDHEYVVDRVDTQPPIPDDLPDDLREQVQALIDEADEEAVIGPDPEQ